MKQQDSNPNCGREILVLIAILMSSFAVAKGLSESDYSAYSRGTYPQYHQHDSGHYQESEHSYSYADAADVSGRHQEATGDGHGQEAVDSQGGPFTDDAFTTLASTVLPLVLGGSGGGSSGSGRSFLSTLTSVLPLLLSPRDEHTHSSQLPVADLLRMVGFDSNKIGTIVINAIVYVIDFVSSSLFGASNSVDSRNLNSPGAIVMYLFDTKRAERFMKTISDPDYPGNIIKQLQRATGNDTVCIQQLICKMSPFWWGVNRSITDLMPIALGKSKQKFPSIGWKALLQKYVPSLKEFSANSDLCEARYQGCVVVTLTHVNAHNEG